jgi:hypothetical protein
MSKKDLSRELQALYFPSPKAPVIVDVPAMTYFMVDGKGNPNRGKDFPDALAALYGLAYTLKFALKESGRPFTIMPLEALWWTAGKTTFDPYRKSGWAWTAMLASPEKVRKSDFDRAVRQASSKKPEIHYGAVRMGTWKEGRSAQILHIGPYAAEQPTIERLHAFIEAQGYRPRGKHHEIYLGDPRRSAPSKLKTVVRQPVERSPR